MKKIDLIISLYLINLMIYVIFLILANDFEVLLFAVPLALIPLIFAINGRRKISNA